MATRYTFNTADETELSRSVLVELRHHATDPAKRTIFVQFGDDIDSEEIDAVIVHDHTSGFIYDAEISTQHAMTADSAKAANIILEFLEKKTATLPKTPPPASSPLLTQLPSTSSRQKISQVAASATPPTTHLEELP